MCGFKKTCRDGFTLKGIWEWLVLVRNENFSVHRLLRKKENFNHLVLLEHTVVLGHTIVHLFSFLHLSANKFVPCRPSSEASTFKGWFHEISLIKVIISFALQWLILVQNHNFSVMHTLYIVLSLVLQDYSKT